MNNNEIIKRYNEWLNNQHIDENDKIILKNMSDEEIKDAFFNELSFGTAGIRGKMGLGSNKINKYTIGKVTVGLSNYLNKKYTNPCVVIAYDTRNNSKDYAIETALILNYYKIKTYLFEDYTSTPELSFSVKYLNASAGIVITSSHNSKDYNGYKVYNSLGSQIVPPEDDLIINEVNSIDSFKLLKKAPLNNELFNYVSKEEHISFINENKKVIINKDLVSKYNKDIKITYSSLHGVGLNTSLEIFKELGFTNYNIVTEQCTYDGNFKTAPEPNPEYEINYNLAIKYAEENNSDIILMTDPDADRLGVMYKNKDNKYTLVNGDLLGAIFAYYIINNTKIINNSYMIRSIVTSNLIDKMCDKHGIEVYEVLTGCKNIANKKYQLKDKKYIFGYEESLGYMFDIDVNDKNGFSSMISILEIMSYCKNKNITLDEYIDNIYKEYGYNLKQTLNFEIKDINYKEIIDSLMNKFRNNEISFNNNYLLKDYLKEEWGIQTNALKYTFDDECSIIIRPSGTEPKIKVYISVCDKTKENANKKLTNYINIINNIIKIG